MGEDSCSSWVGRLQASSFGPFFGGYFEQHSKASLASDDRPGASSRWGGTSDVPRLRHPLLYFQLS